MKKAVLFAIAGSGSLWAAHANAQTNQTSAIVAGVETNKMYVTIDAGPAWQQNVNINSGGSVNFAAGFRTDVAVGWNFCPAFAAEFETGLIDNSINSIAGDSLSDFGASANVYEIPILVSAIYRVPLKGALAPYIGAGVGGAATFLDSSNVPLFGFGSQSGFSDTDFTFACQATAGLKYALNERIAIGIAYKFTGTTGHNWSDNNVTFKTDGTMSHAVMATFTWNF